MNEILDAETKKPKQTFYTNLALICIVIAFAFFGSMQFFVGKPVRVDDWMPHLNIIQMVGGELFGGLGFIFSILSLIKKEPWNWKKWLAVILNGLLFLLVVTSISFYCYYNFIRG